MEHANHKEFLKAFRAGTLVEVKFLHRGGERIEVRRLGPQDFGPNLRSPDQAVVYWFADMGDGRPHPFPKHAREILSMRALDERFERQHGARHLEGAGGELEGESEHELEGGSDSQ